MARDTLDELKEAGRVVAVRAGDEYEASYRPNEHEPDRCRKPLPPSICSDEPLPTRS
jgi:hypothetical protein